MFKQLVPLSVLILGLGAVSLPASAKDTSNSVKPSVSKSDRYGTESVSYSDLDVSTPAGAKVLLARIKRMAERVCGDYSNQDLDRKAEHTACVRETVNETVAQLDNPVLTALAKSDGTPAS